MFAVLSEVNATEAHTEAGREFLNQNVVPGARAGGAKAGYWLAPQNGRGVGVVVFDTEDQARAAAEQFTVGEPPGPGAPEGVTVTTVEVREVLASV